ncbi:MAG: SDR family oxidoreductase [Actinomycetota bacterium]|nr:SDR family oxidoreductase [Actinomycetota bacterium]
MVHLFVCQEVGRSPSKRGCKLSYRYLVTGGAGFIGSTIVEELLRRGHEVRVIDNFSTGRRENLLPFMGDIELLEGDIRSYERVHNAVVGVDYVIHEAALPSVPRSVQDPLTTNAANVEGTLNVLLASRDTGVRRVVLASSSSVYGANHTLPKREDMLLIPISPYGVSKMTAERYACAFTAVYGLETASLRYFNVFGPRQNPFSQYSAVIPRFIRAAISGERVTVFGDGLQTRDFTYVDNVVRATISACNAEGVVGAAVNVAGGERHSLLDLIHEIESLVGKSLDVAFAAPREGDIRDSWADIHVALTHLDMNDGICFSDGLRRTCDALAAVGEA